MQNNCAAISSNPCPSWDSLTFPMSGLRHPRVSIWCLGNQYLWATLSQHYSVFGKEIGWFKKARPSDHSELHVKARVNTTLSCIWTGKGIMLLWIKTASRLSYCTFHHKLWSHLHDFFPSVKRFFKRPKKWCEKPVRIRKNYLDFLNKEHTDIDLRVLMALARLCKTGQLLPTALHGIMQVVLQEISARQYTQRVT